MDLLKNYLQIYNIFARNLKWIFLSLILFLFSCTDQGCIEADDFGEYETQVLEVLASASADRCNYNSALPITDAEQGDGLKECIISGEVVIFNETGESETSLTGCSGLPSVSFQNLCVSQCIAECNINSNSPNSVTAEPNWKSTSTADAGVNGGVTIRPNSEVKIRAIGSVSLGNEFSYPSVYVQGDNPELDSFNEDWSDNIIDVTAGKILVMSFSGKIVDNTKINGGNNIIGDVGSGSSDVTSNVVLNASRRLVAYVVPHPQNYEFDSSQSTEEAGSVNVPLLPDPNMWQCQYNIDNELSSDCGNRSYSSNGYPNVSDTIVNQVFPLTSFEESPVLGQYGGMIRWSGDALIHDDNDFFNDSGVNCLDPACDGAGSLDPLYSRIVGDNSSGDVEIDALSASKVSFRYLLPSVACNGNIDVVVTDDSANVISSETIALNQSDWSGEHISVEQGHNIIIRADNRTYTAQDGTNVSCGRALAMKTMPYHDIRIEKSGFVSLAVLGSALSGSCTIDARIINPNGSHLDASSSYTSDFYEYSKFGQTGDPFRNFTVPVLTNTTLWDNGNNDNGSAKVFVRKGQIIRFSPESWNGTWDAVVGLKRCGIGMAMRIEPRPAFLCRGYGINQIPNSNCRSKYEGGNLVGCEADASECYDSQGNAYCPLEDCHKPVNCDPGSESSIPPFTRTNCRLGALPYTPGSLPDPGEGESMTECTFAYTNVPSGLGYSATSCDSCSHLKLAAAQESPFLDQDNLSFCYNLENYQGKVSNIPISGFSNAQISDAAFAKGAQELKAFNGEFGHLGDFTNSGNVDEDNGNKIFTATKIMNIANSGRLRFLFLDGNDFKDYNIYYGDNNSASGNSYNGVNGFRIDLSSYLEFINGQWLEAIFCEESGDDSVDCRNNTRPTSVSGQPKLVELDNPSGGNLDAVSNTSFKLNEYGELVRTKPSSSTPPECINALVGDVYYCHTYDTNVNRLRISFKIKDPEEADCYIGNPGVTRNSGSDPAYDGIIMTNAKYRASDCNVNDPDNLNPTVRNGVSIISNNGGVSNRICQPNADTGQTCLSGDGPDCTKEFICADKYSNNSGRYYVTVRVKNPDSNISNIVDAVVSPVIEAMDGNEDGTKIGQAERIYRLIVDDPRYQAILSMCLIVMFTFYGLTYLMGVSDMSISDIFMRVLKIGLIYLFVGPQGWEWFDRIVVQFFKNGTDYVSFLMASSFDDSPELQTAINNFEFYDKSVLFKSVDRVFTLLFSSAVQKKISALLFANIFGFVYIIIIYYAIIAYIFAVSTAVLLYLTAQVFISVLFVLGPLFFVFTLFGPTKEMFDKWLQQLIGFSLQQIFLLTTLAFFNLLMYEVIKMALGYKVCWDEVWTINIITRITLMSFWSIPSLPPDVDAQIEYGSIGKNDGIPSFFAILFIWIVAKLMQQFMNFMTEVASEIGGGISATQLSSGVAGAVRGFRGEVGKKIGEAWKGSGGKLVERADKALFDSGRLAKQERQFKRRENAKMQSQKSALVSSGRNAINDYKSKHASELAKLDKDQQAAKLKEVRDNAMSKKGKEMGLKPEEIEKLKKDKGNKYVGDNVLAYGGKAVYQGMFKKGGSLTKGIDKEKISTTLTKQQAKDSMANTDAKGRKQMLDALKEGKLNVNSDQVHGVRSISKIPRLAANLPSRAIKGIRNEAKSAYKKAIHDDDYSAARNQLIDEGEISKMRAGTEWSRSDMEKKKIRDRAKEIRKKKGSDMSKMTKASTIASLEVEDQYLSGIESGASSGDGLRSDNFITRNFVGRRGFDKFSKKKKEAISDIKDQRLTNIRSQYEKHAEDGQKDVDNASISLDRHNATIEAINGDESFQANNARLSEIDSTMKNDKSLTPEQRTALSKERANITSNDKFKSDSSKLKAAYQGRNLSQAMKDTAQQRVDGANEKIDRIDKINRIRDVVSTIEPRNDEEKAQFEAIKSEYDDMVSGRVDQNSVDGSFKEFEEKHADFNVELEGRMRNIQGTSGSSDDDSEA